MGGADLMTLAQQERADLLAMLRGLTPDEWSAPSLCSAWSVRDVALHVVSYDPLSTPALVAAFARGGLRAGAVNEVVLRRYGDLRPDQVLDVYAHHLRPRGLTAGFGGGIALTDGVIHHQDVRRALGRPRDVPAERVRAALGFALRAPTLPARSLVRGLRLSAPDLGWRHGDGPEVAGPGEALLMAVAGRRVALDELEGPGVALLRERVA